ncbi:MAG: hypothetical protein IPL28_09605 [Chloroflexi bacterium]|nr:hypothetical protein [Chloroflexota bacterium]
MTLRDHVHHTINHFESGFVVHRIRWLCNVGRPPLRDVLKEPHYSFNQPHLKLGGMNG